jgi:hypothetical protein
MTLSRADLPNLSKPRTSARRRRRGPKAIGLIDDGDALADRHLAYSLDARMKTPL